jgi:CubicO group peptidase (beta-lactamase class C family)
MSTNQAGPVDPRFTQLDEWVNEAVASRKLAHAQTIVFKSGATIHTNRCGVMDLATGRALRDDAIFRIYSMTKPVTAVAMMALVEDGACDLDDALAKYIPAFADTHVYCAGAIDAVQTEPPRTPLTIRHLLTHTGGLTYANQKVEPIATLYRNAKVDFSAARNDFANAVDDVAQLPLAFHPGTRWHYSISHDLLGRLIEVISEHTFDQFLEERIFKPLEMLDTGFRIAPENHHRLPAIYGYDKQGQLKDISTYSADRFLRGGTLLSGGGGLVSTAADYLRFARMLLNSGELDGVRILREQTVDRMTRNELSGDLPSLGAAEDGGDSMAGIGFGLIGAIMLDPIRSAFAGSTGDYCWGGAASTYFWVDPKEDMVVVFMTQLMPPAALPTRREVRRHVYAALAGQAVPHGPA